MNLNLFYITTIIALDLTYVASESPFVMFYANHAWLAQEDYPKNGHQSFEDKWEEGLQERTELRVPFTSTGDVIGDSTVRTVWETSAISENRTLVAEVDYGLDLQGIRRIMLFLVSSPR